MAVFLSHVTSYLPTIMLLLFFFAFVGIVIMTFNPKQKEKLEEYGQIPLKENDNGGK